MKVPPDPNAIVADACWRYAILLTQVEDSVCGLGQSEVGTGHNLKNSSIVPDEDATRIAPHSLSQVT
jgi:hypothetical protein